MSAYLSLGFPIPDAEEIVEEAVQAADPDGIGEGQEQDEIVITG